MSIVENNPVEIARRQSHAGRRVLVTGAGRGIGRAIAPGFANRGATVGIADMNDGDIAETAHIIRSSGRGRGVALKVDVSEFDTLERELERVTGEIGGYFDTLVNNAGISPKHNGVARKVREMDPAGWCRVLSVNLTGSFNTIRVLSPAMRAAGSGWIINMSSVAGKAYMPVVACHHATTKPDVAGFTRHLAAEPGPHGIRVNAIAPGRIETPMVMAVAKEVNDAQVAMTPMGRLGRPEEVAGLALYLSSPESGFITGQTIDVAGGLLMT